MNKINKMNKEPIHFDNIELRLLKDETYLEKSIFEVYCYHCAQSDMSRYPLPISIVAKCYPDLRYHTAYKIVKRLQTAGLLEPFYFKGTNNFKEPLFGMRGFKVTTRGKRTSDFKKARKKEKERLEKLMEEPVLED